MRGCGTAGGRLLGCTFAERKQEQGRARVRRIAGAAREEKMMAGAVGGQSFGRVGEGVVRDVDADAGVAGVGERGSRVVEGRGH